MPDTVLVTGAFGLVGLATVRRLIDEGHRDRYRADHGRLLGVQREQRVSMRGRAGAPDSYKG